MPTRLDDIDRRILRALQRDGRLQNVELAKEAGLSPSPCLRRVRLLEEAGVIDRYVAVLNASKIGLGLSMFARVWLTAQDAETIDHFMAAMKQLPQVMECYIMLGESDALLRVVVPISTITGASRLRISRAKTESRTSKPTCQVRS
jgi:Lrp/AsnC family leucine-responsive transcriptional regulator